MEPMISVATGLRLASKLGDFLGEAYRSRRTARVKNFLHYVDLRYEVLLDDDREKFIGYVSSEEGQEVLASYTDAILGTQSEVVRMAIAMLYCNDSDFDFADMDRFIFLNAMQGISDDTIGFFIEASKQPNSDGPSPYPRSYIDESRMESFRSNGWGVEGIYVYVNDLIGRRLLLPDPAPEFSNGRHDGQWAVWFGISNKSRKMASLLAKAKVLIEKL